MLLIEVAVHQLEAALLLCLMILCSALVTWLGEKLKELLTRLQKFFLDTAEVILGVAGILVVLIFVLRNLPLDLATVIA